MPIKTLVWAEVSRLAEMSVDFEEVEVTTRAFFLDGGPKFLQCYLNQEYHLKQSLALERSSNNTGLL